MAARTPLTKQDRARILELHAQGMSRNDIAREVGRAAASVTKVVTEAGGTFDRTATKAATEAKQADAASIRAKLELEYAEDARRLREQLWRPHLYFDWGGKDHDYDEREMPEPTPTDKLKLIQASAAALNSSIKISDHGRRTIDLSAVDAWLEHMFGGAPA